MTPAAFDFRKPPPGELGRLASGWLTAAGRRASASWARLLPYPATLALGTVEVVAAGAALAALPEDAVAIPLTSDSDDDGTVLLMMRRPLLLALFAGLVGEIPAALPTDRDVTELELSLLDFLIRELFLDALEKGWPALSGPRFASRAAMPPQFAWTGSHSDLALFATLDAATPFGEHPVYLLVPRTGLGARLGGAGAAPRAELPAPSAQMEALVREMAVELTVLLGRADLTMHDLAALRAGDVIVLDQKVNEPLDGLLAGTRKFRVWPGTVGDRAAVVIDAPADPG